MRSPPRIGSVGSAGYRVILSMSCVMFSVVDDGFSGSSSSIDHVFKVICFPFSNKVFLVIAIGTRASVLLL